MFVYVFTEADREKLTKAGFHFVYQDTGAKAWVFLMPEDGADLSVLDDMRKVITSRMTFAERTGKLTNGGGRCG